MKLSKLLLAGAFAASSVSAFAADVTVRMTGSTAFRSSTMTGILNYFGAAPDLKIVATNASLNSANQATFRGTVGGKLIMVQCSWSGAMEGVRVVADNSNILVPNFLTEASLALDTTAGGTAHANIGTSGNVESQVADVAMGDSTQVETGYVPAAGAYSQLVETPVGVIPFVWVKGKSDEAAHQTALNAVTNITSLQAQAILFGYSPISLFTNNQADVGTLVKVCGRDFGSGTRLDTFLESGFGRDTAPVQYTYTVAGGKITVLAENASPELGYSSGSFLRTAVATPVAAGQDGVVFSYMGISDAAGISGMTFDNNTGTFIGAAAGQVLTFNGVPYSHAAVKNGSYTFWNYQVLMHRNTLAGDKLDAVDAIKQQIIDADAAVGGIKLSDMNVTRNGAGQLITSLN